MIELLQDGDELIFDEDDILTTIDNPYDPVEETDQWRAWDRDNEHFTPELIDRFAEFSENDDPHLKLLKYNNALLQIFNADEEGVYKLV